jgi:nucleoside-diphosphate-sugar epimerase
VSRERVLVTGASGLVGRRLAQRLRAEGLDVHEVSRGSSESDSSHAVDLTDGDATTRLLSTIEPTMIFHLAGGPAAGWENLYAANVRTTVNVMEAAAQLSFSPRVVLVGSAAEYGSPPGGVISETSPTDPHTDYGRAKLTASVAAREIASDAALSLCVVRPFNVVARDLPAGYALGNMRRQLLTGTGPVRVVRSGRIDIVRDFVSADDVVAALWQVCRLAEWPEILNVCSGVPIVLGDILAAMARAAGVRFEVEFDSDLAGIPAVDSILGDPTRLHALGVVPRPTTETIARLMMCE